MDGGVRMSLGQQTYWASAAAVVLYDPTGKIKARDSTAYAASAAAWSATDRREHDRTCHVAERLYDAWTDDDDRYVLDHLHDSAREVALVLGRTTWAVRRRRWYLRRHQAARGIAGHSVPSC